ncbi:hypothetical protein OG225_07050 [Nocardia sp. NBC_01377]|uniref:hypothetical protein n=1 Tax=Nocardia sp. NBC_01377 TaxID=2903595 RepID=UPI00324F82CB
MPTPTAMIATVGLNPVPVVLAVLTREPTQVTLVPSTTTQGEAERIRDLLTELRPELDIRVQCCGAADEFPPTLQALRAIADRTPGPYLLDYSGGNKIMAVSAVRTHLERHDGGGQRWRSVVDDTTGTLVTGSTEIGAGTLDVRSTGLTLARIARLHGYEITPGYAGFAPATVRAEDWWRWADAISRKSGLPEAAQREAMVRALPEELHPPATRQGDGKPREIAVWVSCSRILQELCGDADIEVAFAVNPRISGSATAADFDVVVRHGHRVLEIEVKSSAFAARTVLGQRVAYARMVFGSATTAAVAAPRGHIDSENTTVVEWDEVSATARHLETHTAWIGKVPAWQLNSDGPGELHDGLRHWLFPPAAATTNRADDCTGRQLGVVIPALGTPLAVHAAIRAGQATPVAESAATTGHQTGPVTGLVAADDRDRDGARARFRRWQPAPARFVEISGFGEAQVYERIKGGNADAVVITPGPKGIAAALTRLSYEHDIPILHIGLDGRRHDLDGARTPAHTPDWDAVLAPRYEPVHDLASPRFARMLSTLLPGTRMWQPASSQSSTVTAELIITGDRGCCSIHALDLRHAVATSLAGGTKMASGQRKTAVRNFRLDVLSRSADVAALVGDLHRPLLFLYNVSGDDSHHTAVQATALAHQTAGQPDPVWERWQRTERWLPPGLWSVEHDRLLFDSAAIGEHLGVSTPTTEPK